MSNTADRSLATAATQRPPLYRDAVVVKWFAQVVTLVLVVAALWFLAVQAGDNLEAKSIKTGFDFLEIDPGINLNGTIDDEPDTGGRALYAGMVNTIRLAAGGILLANIPLLVHIIIFFAVLSGLENFNAGVGPINSWLHVSNKGVSIPRIHVADGFYQWMVFILIGAIIGSLVRTRRQAQQDATGTTTYPTASMLGVIALFGAIGWFLHPVFGWVGGIFDAVGDGIDSVPADLVQVLLTVLAVGVAANWIRRFLNSRRTPAGLAKLTDDDYFRMIFAGVGAVFAGVFIWILWPGGSSWLVNSGSDLFNVLGDKFGDGRDGAPLGLGRPDLEQRGNFPNPGPGGLNFSQGFAAVFFGIVLYTAAFIAEIVRAGILAVPKGQAEAAQAIGLRRSTMLRRVILPQAFRVSLPPLGNQYLNLTKNTSLAIAVGASDLVQVGQTVYNQTGKSLEVFAIWMGFYLACSLTISVVVNFFNVRLAIVER